MSKTTNLNERRLRCRLLSRPIAPVEMVQLAQNIVESSCVVDLVNHWRIEDETVKALKDGKPTAGRYREVSIEAVLVIWMLCALLKRPHHYTEMGRIVAHEFDHRHYKLLGLTPIYFDPRDVEAAARAEKTWMHRIQATVETIRATFEQFPTIKRNRRYTKDEYDALSAEFGFTFAAKRKRRVITLSNQLLWQTFLLLGQDNIAKWKGHVVADGTPIKVSNQGTTKTASKSPQPPKRAITSRTRPTTANPREQARRARRLSTKTRLSGRSRRHSRLPWVTLSLASTKGVC